MFGISLALRLEFVLLHLMLNEFESNKTGTLREKGSTFVQYLLQLVVKIAKMISFFFFFIWTLWTNAALSICLFVHLILKSVIYSIEHSRKCVTTQQQMSGRCYIMARSFGAEQPMHKIWMTKYEWCLSTRQDSRCAKFRSPRCPNDFVL